MILIQKNQIVIVNHHLIKRVMDVKNGIKNMIHGVTQLTMIHHVVLKLQKIEDTNIAIIKKLIVIVSQHLKKKVMDVKNGIKIMIHGVTQLTMIHHVVLKVQKIEDILIVAHFLKIKLKQKKLKKKLMIN